MKMIIKRFQPTALYKSCSVCNAQDCDLLLIRNVSGYANIPVRDDIYCINCAGKLAKIINQYISGKLLGVDDYE